MPTTTSAGGGGSKRSRSFGGGMSSNSANQNSSNSGHLIGRIVAIHVQVFGYMNRTNRVNPTRRPSWRAVPHGRDHQRSSYNRRSAAVSLRIRIRIHTLILHSGRRRHFLFGQNAKGASQRWRALAEGVK